MPSYNRPRTPNRLRRETNTADAAMRKLIKKDGKLRDPRWGNVEVGDMVTSRGRHGVGQPVVTGELIHILPLGDCILRLPDDSKRHRTISNLRKV